MDIIDVHFHEMKIGIKKMPITPSRLWRATLLVIALVLSNYAHAASDAIWAYDEEITIYRPFTGICLVSAIKKREDVAILYDLWKSYGSIQLQLHALDKNMEGKPDLFFSIKRTGEKSVNVVIAGGIWLTAEEKELAKGQVKSIVALIRRECQTNKH